MKLSTSILARFIPAGASREMRRLILGTALLNLAASAVGLFEPVFLYSLGLGLPSILAYFLAIHLLTFLLFPVGVRISSRLGTHHAILLSGPMLIVYYLSLFASKYEGSYLALAVIGAALTNVLYWPNFHMEMVREGKDGERGREISSLTSLALIASIAGPVLGGLLIAGGGFKTLFAVASGLILVSNIPLMTLPERRSSTPPSYGRLYGQLLELGGERKRIAVSMLGFGDELLALAVWPVFIFAALKGYAEMGFVVSGAILLSTLAVLLIGRLSDTQSKHALLKTGVIFTAASWIVRIFIRTRIGVFGADAFYRVSRNLIGVPLMSMLYARAKGVDSYEPIIFFEMWLALGKAFTAVLALILLAAFPGQYEPLFILSGLMTLLYARFP
jgi:hypothetical protein